MQETVTRSSVQGAVMFREGKVREVYEAGDEHLVIVASDRLSAFDVVHPTPIPDQGRVLTQLSNFWFAQTAHIVPNHLDETEIPKFPEPFRSQKDLDGRSVYVQRCERIDIECVARGYISGSAWSEYKKDGTVAGERLPRGLEESARLDEPIFTPATKAVTGVDEDTSRRAQASPGGKSTSLRLQPQTLACARLWLENTHRRRGVRACTP